MAREIKTTRRSELVSPSGTASRMGVVDVYSPNISKMFGAVSDTMNTLAENQVKILDAKWQNNFETTTTKYLLKEQRELVINSMQQDLTVLMQLHTMEDQLQYKMVLISKVTRVVQNGIQT